MLKYEICVEPGYYEAKEFGIRIENVVQAVPAPETKRNFDGRGALKLFDITMVPIQRKLIDMEMMNKREVRGLTYVFIAAKLLTHFVLKRVCYFWKEQNFVQKRSKFLFEAKSNRKKHFSRKILVYPNIV